MWSLTSANSPVQMASTRCESALTVRFGALATVRPRTPLRNAGWSPAAASSPRRLRGAKHTLDEQTVTPTSTSTNRTGLKPTSPTNLPTRRRNLNRRARRHCWRPISPGSIAICVRVWRTRRTSLKRRTSTTAKWRCAASRVVPAVMAQTRAANPRRRSWSGFCCTGIGPCQGMGLGPGVRAERAA
jgi:hypothetical protein